MWLAIGNPRSEEKAATKLHNVRQLKNIQNALSLDYSGGIRFSDTIADPSSSPEEILFNSDELDIVLSGARISESEREALLLYFGEQEHDQIAKALSIDIADTDTAIGDLLSRIKKSLEID